AQSLRSPFDKPEAEAIQQKIQQMSGCLSPDPRRRKQPLEKYPLSNLSMRGTLGEKDVIWALLEASDATIHRVAVGSYLGLNNGHITTVSPFGVKVIELISDGAGCWVERETTIKMIKSAWSSDLIGIKYNTLQNDEIELQFELTKEIVNPPEMKTVMNPAQIKITFDADNFNENLLKTSVEHAGVSHISVQRLAGKVVATVHLDQLSVFDVQQKGNLFSLILNKAIGDSPVTRVNPLGNNFINNIDSIDFRKGDNDEAQILVYLDDSMVAVDVADKLGKLYIEFHNTQIINDLLYKLDVTDFGTLVT
ncbi:pilus assembly protein, partial [Baffinella frigidus]